MVDDDDQIRLVVTEVLRARGYRVIPCASAGQALEYLREVTVPPAMVLSDVVLPGMNGYALADQLRNEFPHLAVLLMSGRLPELLPRGDAGMGFGQILEKPFSPESLLGAIVQRLNDGSTH